MARLMGLVGKWRVFMVLALLFAVLYEYTKDIRVMCQLTGVPASQYFFPFFLCDYIVATGLSKVLILLVFVVIVCNISNKQEEVLYYVTRTGRQAMIYGDVLFIATMALGYCLFIYLCSILCFLPYLEFQSSWGKIIGTLAYTDAALQYGYMFVIPAGMIEMYDPINGTLLSFVLLFAGCLLLGLVVYSLNLFLGSQYYGVGAACFLVLFSPIVSYARLTKLYWISPISWVSAENLYPIQNTQFPSVAYAIGMFIAISGGIIALLSIYSRKSEIGGGLNGWTAD